jgi:hypothetical protein
MGAVALGASALGIALGALALVLFAWRRRLARSADERLVDLVVAEVDAHQTDVVFDGIVGHLLLTDPTFADNASRLTGQDEPGPGT